LDTVTTHLILTDVRVSMLGRAAGRDRGCDDEPWALLGADPQSASEAPHIR
jgi:hypothetical protein